MTNPPIQIYRSADGQAQVEVRFGQETVWLSQAQMVELFGRDVSVISRHIRNALAEGEIDEKSNLQKMQIASADRPVTFYDLETIITVGYRIKSPQGVAFRRWATTRLKEYLLHGYTLNRQRLQHNAAELEQALALIRKTAASPELTLESGRGLVDIVSRYAQTFAWLQQYDEGLLTEPAGEAGGELPDLASARAALQDFKQQLIARGERTIRARTWRRLSGTPRQPGANRLRRTGLSRHRKQSRAPTVFCREEPSLCRRQQTQWRLPLRGLPAPQRPPV